MTIEPNGRTREQNLATLAGLNRNFAVRSRQAIEERLHGRPGDDVREVDK